jgi:SNF2 family DNA or RNA helicase
MPELAALSREMPWGHVIADEVHRLQGRKTQQTRALKAIRTLFRTGLSGTPVTGNPANYWSVLNWLYPQQWSSFWRFYKEHVDYEIIYPQGFHKIIGPKNPELLLQQVAPFYVRHLKRLPCCPHHPNGVMPWLPEKYYTVKHVELSAQQRRAYNDMKNNMIAWVGQHGDQPVPAPVVIAQMQRLQQFALAYAHVDESGQMRLSEPSSKLDAVMEILEELDGAPLVVFSQFAQPILLLEQRLKKAGISYGLYTGLNRATRDDVKREFARGGLRVFAGTIQSGGEALDGLQNTCSTMVFLDRTWSPGSNQQAEDRLDRDGQTKPVQIIDIVARGTVDLGRHQKLEAKWSWIRQLLGDPTSLQREFAA